MNYDKKISDMLNRLRSKGIRDEDVLKAMEKTPRHQFVAHGLEHQAYDEKALPIGYGQTISHPYTVALMTQTLQIKKSKRILEIGTGSGYQAAVIAQMGAQVYTIEKVKQLGIQARKILESLKYHVITRIGDGTMGWLNYAPYDAIIVTAGAPVTPENLINQLKDDGKLLIPIGNKDEQMLTLYIKNNDTFKKIQIEKLKFVPLVGNGGW
ncbi:MAG: protein-L-isoaspartate(D-aspartate) O-methyltransferase [Calditrichaceae bacterium]|nr:protein-L-isoaspartate(D-aspartate) O-methyltransferase [Calditrichaceae bacterium]